MWQNLGHLVQQSGGFKAFMPLPFPIKEPFTLSSHQQMLNGEAMRLIGKLDGISTLLPDHNFFLLMFVRKEAASSSQIEGTQATMIDAIAAQVLPSSAPQDVEDIIRCIEAFEYGKARLKTIPICIRFIKELHEKLMRGARATQHSYPGEFRSSQNWIGGTSPLNATYVPPPAHEVTRAMSDVEKFFHTKENDFPPLIKAALLHAHFETIHPFTDGNGRTGRLLITFFLWQEKILELPLLYLSTFFKKHKDLYYSCLQGYHSSPANIGPWLEFFLEGVIQTSNSAVHIIEKINVLREKDMEKVHALGKVAAKSSVEVLKKLYQQPIVDVATVQKWTHTTRAGAQKIIDRLIELKILKQRRPEKSYGRTYDYRTYIELFQQDERLVDKV
jgi:cell filamentation protein, protein adenylyltransferase